MKVRLNLATKPLESHRRFLASASVTALVAAVVFAALGWHVYSVREAASEGRARMERMGQERAKYEAERNELKRFFEQKNIKGLNDRAAFINGIIVARSFNWTQMFMDLEHILPAGVHIISIEPKQVSEHVELNMSFGAASDDAKIKFLRALEDSKQFSDVKEDNEMTATAESPGDLKVVHLSTFYSGT